MSINEAATIQTTSINAITPTTGTLSVGNTQTTGVLNVGTGVRTAAGVMNIATGASNACAINIMNGGATVSGSVNIANVGANTTAINIGSTTGTGAISIQTANTGNSTSSPAIAIGTTDIVRTIRIGSLSSNNTVYIGNLEAIKSAGGVEVNSGNENMFIGNKQTSAILNIGSGTGSRASGATVNIANQASNACAINIMNGNTTAGSVNIANGTGASQTTAVNIGSGSTTGTVTIGNSANTVQVNGTLAMGTGRNITLQPTAGYVAPSIGQLGSRITNTTVNTASGTGFNMVRFNENVNVFNGGISLTPGVWIIDFTFQLQTDTSAASPITALTSYVVSGSNWDIFVGAQNFLSFTSGGLKVSNEGSDRIGFSNSCVVSHTTTTSYNVVFFLLGTLTGTLSIYNAYLTGTRIA